MKTLKTLLAALAVVVCGSANAYTVNFVDAEDTSYETLSTVEKYLLITKNTRPETTIYLMKKNDGTMVQFNTLYYPHRDALNCCIVKFLGQNNTFVFQCSFGNTPFNFKAQLNPQFIKGMEPHKPMIVDLQNEELLKNGTFVEIISQSKL